MPATCWGAFRKEFGLLHAGMSRKMENRRQTTKHAKPPDALAAIRPTRISRDGRVTVPKRLASVLGEHGGEIVLLGCLNSIQIWSRARFENSIRQACPWNDKDEEALRALSVID